MGLFDPPPPDAVKEKEREREMLESPKESKGCYLCKIMVFLGALLTFSFFYEKQKLQEGMNFAEMLNIYSLQADQFYPSKSRSEVST